MILSIAWEWWLNYINYPPALFWGETRLQKPVNGAWNSKNLFPEAGIERISFKFTWTCGVETACRWFFEVVIHLRLFCFLFWKPRAYHMRHNFAMLYGLPAGHMARSASRWCCSSVKTTSSANLTAKSKVWSFDWYFGLAVIEIQC